MAFLLFGDQEFGGLYLLATSTSRHIVVQGNFEVGMEWKCYNYVRSLSLQQGHTA